MMKLKLENIAKRFGREWIFKQFSYEFTAGKSYALTGNNGSGKSTLIKILSGHLSPSKGLVIYHLGDKEISIDETYRYVSICAPYVELIDEFSLKELIEFQFHFKPRYRHIKAEECIELLQLKHAANKELKNFSSGMKQRVKLGLAVLSDTPLLLLDEPTSNLDAAGVKWYNELIANYSNDRIMVIASNQQHEYVNCDEVIDIMAYK